MKIRIGNDFKTKWAITWLGEPEDFSDATDMSLFFNIYDKKIELTKDIDYTIINNIIEIDVTPDICNILGVYNLELHYTKPNGDFIDGERRSAVDIDAFRIVGKSDKADATQDVSIISDAVAIFLDIAYKKLEEIEANEDVRITNEGEREDAEDIRVANENIRISNEQDRQINTTTAISNAEQATLNANNSAVYANEQGAYAEEMSSHPPTIINDYWHIWNLSTNQYESTGQYARGDSAVEGALVVQEKGQSAVNTMSQKAVTDNLALKANHGYISNPKTLKQVDDSLVNYYKANENSIFTPKLTHSNKDRETAIHKAFKKISLSSKYVHQSNRLYVNYLSLTADRVPIFRIKIIGEEYMFYLRGTPIPESGIIEQVLLLYGTSEEVGYVILDASQFKDVGVTYVPVPADPYNNEILKWSLIQTVEEEDYAVENENRLHQLGLITLPRQLADNSSYITDGYLTANGGVVQTPDYYITDWISVKPNTRYKYKGRILYSRVCIGADIHFKNIHAVVNTSESSTATTEEVFTTSGTTYYVKLCTHKTADSGLWEVDTTINESGHPEYDSVDEMITNHDGRRYAKVGSVIFECMSETPTSIKDFRQINGEKRRVENRWILKESKQLNINGDSVIFSCVDNSDNVYSGTRLTTKEFCNLYKNDDVLYDFGANKKVIQVTPLGNGELMALIEDNTGQQSIWVSSAGASVFTQKFMTSWWDSSNRGRVEGGWGIDAYENIIVVAEYGTHSVSKHVWLSDNYGETFKVLLNVNTDLLSDGTPIVVNLPTSHIHGAFYDPYWERVWVIYADGDNSSILFTDNWGDETPTWHRNSVTTLKWGGAQTVCGKAFPDFILLGSDANYCGVYRLNRTSKKNNLKIEFVHDVMNEGDWELAQVSPYSRKTYVGGNVYQRNYEQPILLSFHRHSYLEDWAKPNLVATYDGINFTNIYQFDNADWGMIVNTDSKGNIYVRPSQDSTRLIILEKK